MKKNLKVLDLFSGIGGFTLGLDRTGGFETVAFCEIEEFPRKVLSKHWPKVPIYNDVKILTGKVLEDDGITGIDIITGGFPCQDISSSGKGAGIESGTRSGLYSEVIRLISELRPKFVIMENVSVLLTGPPHRPGMWFGRILADLAERGYDAEWCCIPASAIGAEHHRNRVWIIAYPNEKLWHGDAKILNSIANQISQYRTSKEVMALLDKVSKLQFTGDEPDHRKIDGVSKESHALGSLGNAVHAEIPFIIGNAILSKIDGVAA